MQGDIILKAPVALVFVVVLVGSLMLNVMHFMQPQQAALGPGTTGVPTTVVSLLPNGQENPLAHRPKSPSDAVASPDPSQLGGGPPVR